MKTNNEPTKITQLAKDCHQEMVDVGWWDNHTDETPMVKLGLIHTEIDEAFEGYEGKLMDDKLPESPMEHVELADVALRVLDMMGFRGYEASQPLMAAPIYFSERFMDLHVATSKAMEACRKDNLEDEMIYLSKLLGMTVVIANLHGFDLFEMIEKKREFNRNREDHKRENRAKEGGKKA